MKIHLSVLLLFIFNTTLYCQDSLQKRWLISTEISLQKNDKRLFDFPHQDHLHAIQPNTYGTYQLSLSVCRAIGQGNNLKIYAGLGFGFDLSTFMRPFDHNYGMGGGNDLLTYTNRYSQLLLLVPIKSEIKISNRFGILLDLLPQIVLMTLADNTEDDVVTFSRFDLYSIELNPGFEYHTSSLSFGLKYRIYQLKKIDKVIFNEIINDPRSEDTFETYNPTKYLLSISRSF